MHKRDLIQIYWRAKKSKVLQMMNNNELTYTDAKSLLQANATILAGALVFLSLRESYGNIVTTLFLAGIYSIIISIGLCLSTTWTPRTQHVRAIELLRRGTCVGGLFSLFLAVSFFLAKP